MVATVSVQVDVPRRYVTLPNAAIVYNTYGSLVYVVEGSKPQTVRQILVKTGPARGDQVAVTEGLAEGQVVVTAGQIKLHPGSTVVVNNAVQPSDNPQPHPAEE
jgi:membrane fusion protein (multidrug efflux system)